MRLAAIYARVSTEEQTKRIVPSTGTQVTECTAKAAALGIPVATAESGLIVEEQHSGADLRWAGTQFMALVHRAQRHEFTDLICLDIDRFCRGGPAAFFEQEGYFLDAKVDIHWVMSDVPDDMPFSGTIKTARAEASQWQRDKIREASMRARTAYAEQGNIIRGNVPPFGFQFEFDPARRTKRNLPVVVGLVPDHVTGPALLYITEWVANGGSVGAVLDWLAAQGIRTVRGNSLVWNRSTILDIFHNHTNYGGRRSHVVHAVPRPEGHRRDASVKTRNQRERVPFDKQKQVADGRITPIPGLTYDLWLRAIARLEENKAFSARHATLSEDERTERGLLFGGLVRCAVCKRALRVKPTSKVKHTANGAHFEYRCSHSCTTHATRPPITMTTTKLDGRVWDVAVYAMRDQAFFARAVAETDASAAAPSVRATSLQARLTEADRDHAILMKHLRKYDPDDADDAGMIADIENDLKANRALRTELGTSLLSAEAEIRTEDARRATLSAFRAYAAAESNTLDDATPPKKRRILRALRTRVRVNYSGSTDRLRIAFDIRHLPGAAAAVDPHAQDDVYDFSDLDLAGTTVEWLDGDDAQPFARIVPWWEKKGYASPEEAIEVIGRDDPDEAMFLLRELQLDREAEAKLALRTGGRAPDGDTLDVGDDRGTRPRKRFLLTMRGVGEHSVACDIASASHRTKSLVL